MEPDEVIRALKEKHGIKITRRTLLRYEKMNLVPEPDRGGKGRGSGRFTEYPAVTVEKAYNAYLILNNSVPGEPTRKQVYASLINEFPDIYGLIKKKIRESSEVVAE